MGRLITEKDESGEWTHEKLSFWEKYLTKWSREDKKELLTLNLSAIIGITSIMLILFNMSFEKSHIVIVGISICILTNFIYIIFIRPPRVGFCAGLIRLP